MTKSVLDLADCPLPELLDSIDVSVRLKNALLSQYHANELPFQNLNEFNKLGERGVKELHRIPNLGKLSILEFMKIVDEVGLKKVINKQKSTQAINLLKNLTIKEFVLVNDEGDHAYKDLFHQIDTNSFQYKYVYQLESVSNEELSGLLLKAGITNTEVINRLLSILYIVFNNQMLCGQNLLPEEYFKILITVVLNDREKFVLLKRFGFHSGKKETLEQIGLMFSVTRERVRQIEKNALLKVDKAIKNEGVDNINRIYRQQINECIYAENTFISRKMSAVIYKHLPPWLRLFIKCANEFFSGYLSEHYFYSNKGNGWYVFECETDKGDIENGQTCSLKEAISKATWPIKIEQLSKIMRTPIPVVIDNIKHNPKKYSINTVNDTPHLIIKNVNKKDAMRYILRRYKRAMKLEEIAAAHQQMFGKSVSIGAVNNTLGIMHDALIVDRGTYNLYENMNLGVKDLSDIKNSAINILMELQSFISSKVLYRKLVDNDNLCNRIRNLNGYSLLGIFQDDIRFICRRGLMIGLRDPDFTGTFKPLTQEIYELVLSNRRPLLINEIIYMLSETRELMYPSVQALLKSCPEFEETTAGAFTIVDSSHYQASLSDQLDKNAIFSDW